MTIEQISTSKVLISLCSEDMTNFDLEFGKMGFCNEHSKRVLLRLLQVACRKAGVNYKSKTVMMEALPHKSGCLLFVTVMDKKTRRTYRVKRIYKYMAFVFENAEKMLCAVETLYRRNCFLKGNALWLYDNRYYLVLLYPSISGFARNILMEYAFVECVDETQMSRIEEGGKILCEDNAVEIIGSKMHKQAYLSIE